MEEYARGQRESGEEETYFELLLEAYAEHSVVEEQEITNLPVERVAYLASRGLPGRDGASLRGELQRSDFWLSVLTSAEALEGLAAPAPRRLSPIPSGVWIGIAATVLVLAWLWLGSLVRSERVTIDQLARTSTDHTVIPGLPFPETFTSLRRSGPDPGEAAGGLTGSRRDLDGRVILGRAARQLRRNPGLESWLIYSRACLAANAAGDSWIPPARALRAHELGNPQVRALLGLYHLKQGHLEVAIELLASTPADDLHSRWNLAVALMRLDASRAALSVLYSLGSSPPEVARRVGREESGRHWERLIELCEEEQERFRWAARVRQQQALPGFAAEALAKISKGRNPSDSLSELFVSPDAAWILFDRLLEHFAGDRHEYLDRYELGPERQLEVLEALAFGFEGMDRSPRVRLDFVLGLDEVARARWARTNRSLQAARILIPTDLAKGIELLEGLEEDVRAVGDPWLEWLRRGNLATARYYRSDSTREEYATEWQACKVMASVEGFNGSCATMFSAYNLGSVSGEPPALEDLEVWSEGFERCGSHAESNAVQRRISEYFCLKGFYTRAYEIARRAWDDSAARRIEYAGVGTWRAMGNAQMGLENYHVAFFLYLQGGELSRILGLGVAANAAFLSQLALGRYIDLTQLQYTDLLQNRRKVDAQILYGPEAISRYRLRASDAALRGDRAVVKKSLEQARRAARGHKNLEVWIRLDEFLLRSTAEPPPEGEIRELVRTLIELPTSSLKQAACALAARLLECHERFPGRDYASWAWVALEASRRREWSNYAGQQEPPGPLENSPLDSTVLPESTAILTTLTRDDRQIHLCWSGSDVRVSCMDAAPDRDWSSAVPPGTRRLHVISSTREQGSESWRYLLQPVSTGDHPRDRSLAATCALVFSPTADQAVRALQAPSTAIERSLFIVAPLRLPLLAGSRDLAESLQSEGDQSIEVLLDSERHQDRIRSELERADWIHIGTHLQQGEDSQQTVELVLVPDVEKGGQPSVSKLLAPLRLRKGSTVILAACNSGLGLIESEPYGIATEFLRVGAGRVVATVAEVDDRAMATIARALFDRCRQGQDAAEALRELRAGGSTDEAQATVLENLVVIEGAPPSTPR